MSGSARDIDHAVWLAERNSPAAPSAVADAAFWVDKRLREASTSAARATLYARRKRLTEAAAKVGLPLRPSAETSTGTPGGPQVRDFTEMGLSETDAASAVEGLRAGRYLSFEDAFWSTKIFESKNSAGGAPDAVKLREKARQFAGIRITEAQTPTHTPWGREVASGQQRP